MKEFEFISYLEKSIINKNKYIGDDAALIYNRLLVSKDIISENIHFLPSTPLKYVIHKLFTCNISDIASMGAVSKYVLLGLALKDKSYLKNIIPLIEEECNFYNVELAGGDTASSERNFFSLTVLGEKGRNIIYRSGAEKGDIIFISRPLGRCRISLEKELNQNSCNIDKYYHYSVNAEDKLGIYLGSIDGITSMTDISDGLGVDLNNIALSSNKKAVIEYNRLDLSYLDEYGIDNFDYFISSGEEFALVFTVKNYLASKIQKDILDYLNINIIPVGRIEDGSGIYLEKDGYLQKIDVAGYEHFDKNGSI